MGLGGILAAIAQGAGGAMVKIAEKDWEREAEERKYQFLREQSEKRHQNDVELKEIESQNNIKLEGVRHQNTIAQQANKARIDLKTNQDSDNKKAINEAYDSIKAIEFNQAQITQINERLSTEANTLTEEGKQTLLAERERLTKYNQTIANNTDLWRKIETTGSQSLQAKWQSLTMPYRPKTEVQAPKVEPKAPPVVGKVGEPNMINANDPEAIKKAYAAVEQREKQARLNNVKQWSQGLKSQSPSQNQFLPSPSSLARY